jgi:hypothetical protein
LEFVDSQNGSLNDQVSGQHEAILPAPEKFFEEISRRVSISAGCRST